MKMRKIMAAGIAATMAVTSLAAVASAETLTFPMGKSQSKQSLSGVKAYYFTDNSVDVAAVAKDTMIRLTPASAAWEVLEGAELVVTGFKANAAGAASTTTTTEAYKFIKQKDGSLTLVLTKDTFVNKDGYMNISAYTRVTGAEIKVSASHMCYDEPDYTAHNGLWGTGKALAALQVYNGTNMTALTFAADDAELANFVAVTGSTAATATNADAAALKVIDYLGGSVIADSWTNADSEKKDLYALLKQTTNNPTIMRQDVKLLSDTGAWESETDTSTDENKVTDGNQSYDDNGLGTSKNRFGGLASQVADFFNHKSNGTITMKFTTVAGTDSGWLNGGVPSTQIGIKNLLAANNFALYVNYASSTGSLEATTSVDKNAGTVTFDISEILADLGGQTKGVVTDLYYGLNQGISYGAPYNDTGLLVEEIILAYEDDATDEDILEEEVTEEEVTEEEVTEEEVTEEEEVTIEEEEEEVTEEEEEEVDGEMFEEEETEEEDVNPGTGVALAVVPAMIAAAAAVVSKKRK